MSGSAIINGLTQLSNCGGSNCDCCKQLESKINNLENRIAKLEGNFNNVDEDRIVNKSVNTVFSSPKLPILIGTVVAGSLIPINARLASLGNIVLGLESSLAQIFSKIGALTSKIGFLEKALESLKGALKPIAAAVGKLMPLIAHVAALVSLAINIYQLFELIGLKQAIANIFQLISGIRHDLGVTNNIVDAHTSQIADNKEKINIVGGQFNNFRNNYYSEIETIHRDLGAKTFDINQLRSTIAELRASMDYLNGNINTVKSDISALKGLKNEINQVLDKATQALNSSTANATAINGLKQEIASLKNQIGSATGINEVKALAQKAINLANSASGIANNAINKAETANSTANTAIGKANDSNAKSDNALGQIGSLRNDINSTRNIANNANSKAEIANSTANTAIGKANDAINKITYIDQRVTNINNIVNNYDQRINKIEGNTNIALGNSNKALDNSNTTLNKVNNLENNVNQVKNEINNLNQFRNDLGNTVNNFKRELGQIDNKIDSKLNKFSFTRNLSTDNQLKTQQSEIDKLKSDVSKNKTDIDKNKKTQDMSNAQLNRIENKLDTNLAKTALITGLVTTTGNSLKGQITNVGNKINGNINTLSKSVTANFNKFKNNLKNISNTINLSWVLNLISATASIHNATMLSRDVLQTFFMAFDNIFTLFGIKDLDGNPVQIGQIIGKGMKDIFTSVLGAKTVTEIATKWHAFNTIYQAATNSFYAIQGLFSHLSQFSINIANNLGKIGNALLVHIFDEDDYPTMPEDLSNTGRLKWLETYTGSANEILQFASAFSQITSDIVQITQEVKQIQDTSAEFGKAVDESVAKVNEKTAESEGDSSLLFPDAEMSVLDIFTGGL